MTTPEFHKSSQRGSNFPLSHPMGEGRGLSRHSFLATADEEASGYRGNSFDVRCSAFDVRCSPVQRQENHIGLPLRRFRPPLPSHIEFRNETPSLLRSEVFIGPIVATRGPFFSSGNWWDSDRWARQEWDVETADGSLFRIFKSSDGCFVEGVYD